jgi:hypothetical protein
VDDVLFPCVPHVNVAVDDEDFLTVFLVHAGTRENCTHITIMIVCVIDELTYFS